MEVKIEITQAEALKLAEALEFAIRETKECSEGDQALIKNLKKIGGLTIIPK